MAFILLISHTPLYKMNKKTSTVPVFLWPRGSFKNVRQQLRKRGKDTSRIALLRLSGHLHKLEFLIYDRNEKESLLIGPFKIWHL